MKNDFDILEALWFRRELKRRAQKTIEGTPPLTFTAKKAGTLTDYRIYGQTVNGESVGDKTGNLFGGGIEQGGLSGRTGAEVSSEIRVRTTPLTITSNTFTINASGVDKVIILVYDGDTFLLSESVTSFKALPYSRAVSDNRIIRFAFGKNDDSTITPSDISNVMLNTGSEPLPYEPYGYLVPVMITNGTDTQSTNIYLPEQIKMVGDEAEYIDFREQKQHFADGTSVDVTLPALPTLSGTNTLSVGSAVQPSKMMIKGKIKE